MSYETERFVDKIKYNSDMSEMRRMLLSHHSQIQQLEERTNLLKLDSIDLHAEIVRLKRKRKIDTTFAVLYLLAFIAYVVVIATVV